MRVVGHAVVGNVDGALRLFSKKRFNGRDLKSVSYHVLLNRFVEGDRLKGADTISEDISSRGLENPVACCIRLKDLFLQNKVEEAKMYFLELEKTKFKFDERYSSSLTSILCKQGNFWEAQSLLEMYKSSSCGGLSRPYRIFIYHLMKSQNDGNGSAAKDFLKAGDQPEDEEGFFNDLQIRCILENVYDWLVEMIRKRRAPDEFTMNVVLCLFCKARMVDVAKELYELRLEVGFSVHDFTYDHLISALCTHYRRDEAYRVLKDCLKHDYSPSSKTFAMLSDNLCVVRKLDKMIKLLEVDREGSTMLDNVVWNKYILSFCEAGSAYEDFLIPKVLQIPGFVLDRCLVYRLINDFVKRKRGDLATELLLKNREYGRIMPKRSCLTIIRFLCEMSQLKEVFNLLEKLLTGEESEDRYIFNCFIEGVGYAKKPEIAQKLFSRMIVRGVRPCMTTKILLLHGYLEGGWIPTAMHSFDTFAKIGGPGTKLYDAMIVGLSQMEMFDDAYKFLKQMRKNKLIPSLMSYEELVKVFCTSEKYDEVMEILKDLEQTGRQASSFICNTLLVQSLKDPKFIQAWLSYSWNSSRSKLDLLVWKFPEWIRSKDLDYLDKCLQKLCPVGLFTYNALLEALKRVGRTDDACNLFYKIQQKGFKPNQFTYDMMLHGVCKQGQREEAKRLREEMECKGFYPSEKTRLMWDVMMSSGS